MHSLVAHLAEASPEIALALRSDPSALLNIADHNVQALTRCEMAFIPREAIQELMTSHPRVGMAMWIDTLIDASIFREWVVNVGRRDARTRLCLAIARHAEAGGETRPEGLWVSKRLGDIGDECAVPAAEVGDIAKQLVSQKLLRIKRDGILVPDLGRLYGYVKSGGP